MDGDAKGQLGGLDAKDEVRREWATRSREWRCDICSGGKTNEEILKAWWEICKAKGVRVDEEGNVAEDATGRDKVPKGLKLGYRDEIQRPSEPKKLPEDQKAENSPKESAATASLASPERPIPLTSSATPSSSTPAYDPTQPGYGGRPGQISGTSVSRGIPETAPPTSNPVNPVPVTTQDITSLRQQNDPLHHRPPAASTDEPWLDRAIVGVIVALILMILKKILLE
jgi:ubiquitin-conjugating enzyme E2 J1